MAEFLRRGRRWAAALLACPLLAAAGQAIEHRVRPGDTLEALSSHYLGSARLWRELQRHNRVPDPRRLQPGSVLQIPLELLPRSAAEVVFVHGAGLVTLPGASQPEPALAGQQLPEGTRAQAGPGSFISVRLADGTVVRVQADSDVLLEQLRRRGRAGDAQSLLGLQRGAVEPSVAPAAGSGRTLEIRTPTATTAVRGTRFVLSLAPDGRTLAAVTEGSVAVASRTAADAPALLSGGQGLAVSAAGRLAAPRPLLPAPDLEALPAVFSDADFLSLRLTPVAEAAAYQVQLASDPQFHAVVHSSTSASAELRLPAPEDGQWYLSVRALDAEGLPGQVAQRAITVKAHPLPPLYQSGTDGQALPLGEALLRCTAVEGAARYRLQVASSADFAQPLLDEIRVGECALDARLLAPGRYHWRAASIRMLPDGSADQGPFGPVQPFAVAARPPTPTSETIGRAPGGTGLQLSWPGGAPGQRYRLQLAAEAGFAEPLVDEELGEPAWVAPALAPGLYYVRIQTLDPSGLRSRFSTARRFRVAASVQDGSGQPVTASDGRPLSAP
ncbi:FecR domain-containing protein [Melaminivora alkalimesophila]|uniref:FecR family protein n=1 Tax=Melaminivora alkalimesophila TaxID=1165852 RepID=A0A317RDR7_9BURK|nr:FecR domain-containing protein [Melaminivora alkalimesophila]PWW47721.1 FecR family protein [Melaminivora alkalimesophila]